MSGDCVYPADPGWYALRPRRSGELIAYPVVGWTASLSYTKDGEPIGAMFPIVLDPDGLPDGPDDVVSVVHREHVSAEQLEAWLAPWREAIGA